MNDLQGAAETVTMIRDAGGEAIENASDITTGGGHRPDRARHARRVGRLDVIVNNAASGSGTVPDEDMVRHTLGVHFVGTVNLVRSALPVFREQRYGRIVNTGSGSVLGIPHTGIYAAGKGAVMAFTKVLANELRQESDLDITVNVIMPVAQTPIMPRVPDEEFQAMLDTAFAPSARRRWWRCSRTSRARCRASWCRPGADGWRASSSRPPRAGRRPTTPPRRRRSSTTGAR